MSAGFDAAQWSPGRFSATTAPFTDAFASAAWGRLTEGWPIECTAPWLTVEYGRVTKQQYITVVEGDGRPLAGAVWFLLDGTEERRGYSAYDVLLGSEFETSVEQLGQAGDRRREAEALRASLPATALAPCAGVALPGSYESAVVWDARLEARDLDEVVRALVDALEASARALGARSIAIQNVGEGPEGRRLRRLLTGAGYLEAAQPPTAVLELPENGLPGYLARLGPKQRKNSEREMRRFAEAVDGVGLCGAERLLSPDIAQLLEFRYRKYGHETSRAAVEDRLERARLLPGMTVLVAERGGRACAFKAFVVDVPRRRIVSRFSGCEPNDYYAYFNLVYYEPIRHAPIWGLTSMELGTETYHAKVGRGSGLEARGVFLKPFDTTRRATVQKACVLRTAVEGERLRAELGRSGDGSGSGRDTPVRIEHG